MSAPSEFSDALTASLLNLVADHALAVSRLAAQINEAAQGLSPEQAQIVADALDDVAALDTAYLVMQRRANESSGQ